jgi:3D (Asp-Asp-Asp) domain-containing protein
MVLELVLVAQLATVTSYRSIPAQTDSSPMWTSIGEHVAPGGCAVSRDLLHSTVPYGTYLYIEGVGLCKVNDTTHERLVKTVDLWVGSYAEEKKFGVKKRKVYKVKLPGKA